MAINLSVTLDDLLQEVSGLYNGGDCGGETQGILQATVTGFWIADGIIQTVNELVCEKS